MVGGVAEEGRVMLSVGVGVCGKSDRPDVAEMKGPFAVPSEEPVLTPSSTGPL